MLLSRRLEESRPRQLLLIIGGLVLAFMLLPAVNLVNINLSRILDRSSEIGVRRAFGASSRQPGRPVPGREPGADPAAAAPSGWSSAPWRCEAINQSGLIAHAQLELNFRVFFYSLLLAIVFGLFPASTRPGACRASIRSKP